MQQQPLLATKLHIPPTRRELVPRPRLIRQLTAGLRGKLTLVSAPAGFGKTTLVSSWMDTLRAGAAHEGRAGPRIAWLSLDAGDNDPTRFLSYVVTALSRAYGPAATLGSSALNMLHSPQPPAAEVILTALINEIAAVEDTAVLVLDDYHVIETPAIHTTLAFLLAHLPPQMHLVIATREDPQLPLARLRARGHLSELRAADLRFSRSEAAEFLNTVMGLALSDEDVSALETRSEGWIAGLQLAAISMQGRNDATGFVRAFAGSHRFVLDYLVDEVLEQESVAVQTFLLRTAILDRMTGSLCDALTGQDNGQATLEALERANLFIVPLDEERRWYRYHHLFADLLRQRLRRTQPEQLPALHRQAGVWYEQHGFIDEATEHALRINDFERAAVLIGLLVDGFWTQGDHMKLRNLLSRLPLALILSKPHLCVYHAWYSYVSGRQDVAAQCLQAAEQAVGGVAEAAAATGSQSPTPLSEPDRAKVRGRLAAIRVYMESYRGDVPEIIRNARQALAHLPADDRTWRSTVQIALGDAYGFKGDIPAAYQVRFEAWKASRAAGDVYFSILATVKLAITLRSQGRLQETVAMCRQQVQIAGDARLAQTPLTGLLLIIWGEALAELGDLDEAKELADRGRGRIDHGMDLSISGWGFMCLMRTLFSRGELTGIEEIIEKVETVNRESNVPGWIMSQMAAWKARLWLTQGRVQAASQWAVEHGLATDGDNRPLGEITFFSLRDYVVLARIRMAAGQPGEAAELLGHLLAAAEAGGRTSRSIEILTLLALARQAQGETDRAIAALAQALSLAEPEGFVRVFVDEGPPLARLLHEALSRGIAPGYTRRLLAAFPSLEPAAPVPAAPRNPESGLIEPLSDRELEVLQLVAEGLTNPEIARKLFLSLNTVKAHTRNIYGKLDAHNRTQAVARAKGLGILV